jgi:putative SOS response-associated peptidase YedK
MAGETEDGDLKELLKPYPADEMKMWPISQRVNSRKTTILRSLNQFDYEAFGNTSLERCWRR